MNYITTLNLNSVCRVIASKTDSVCGTSNFLTRFFYGDMNHIIKEGESKKRKNGKLHVYVSTGLRLFVKVKSTNILKCLA